MDVEDDDLASKTPTVVVYGDFNCPFSGLANARASRLAAAGGVQVDWRCVEHDPSIGPCESPLTEQQRAGFEAELAQIRDMLTADELDRFRVPSRRLNTRDLNVLYASTPPDRRQPLRTALFDAIWRDDLDLTDDAVVRDIVDPIVSEARPDRAARSGASTDTAARIVATWQQEWSELPRPIVPMMILPQGDVSRGLGALARLASGSVSPPSPRRATG